MQSIRYINKLLLTKVMRDLYYTHAYPHLIGTITVWGTDDGRQMYIQPLIRTQKRLVRLITNSPPKTHTKPLMAQHRVLNLPNLYTLRVCTEMHLEAHKLGLKEEHSYSGTVGGKL